MTPEEQRQRDLEESKDAVAILGWMVVGLFWVLLFAWAVTVGF